MEINEEKLYWIIKHIKHHAIYLSHEFEKGIWCDHDRYFFKTKKLSYIELDVIGDIEHFNLTIDDVTFFSNDIKSIIELSDLCRFLYNEGKSKFQEIVKNENIAQSLQKINEKEKNIDIIYEKINN